MKEKLVIVWQNPRENSEHTFNSIRQLYKDYSIKKLIKQAKSLYKKDNEHPFEQTYSIYVTNHLEEIQNFYDQKTVVYEGKGEDYGEFLLVMNVLLSLINTSAERCIFIIKAAAELKYVNREAGARFIDELANEAFRYIKYKKK
ncbi:MAG TPA: hypothetical protein VEY51_04365 [Chondromyces sp.]|nr:hypothetical protein [Chondromyces sp.]